MQVARVRVDQTRLAPESPAKDLPGATVAVRTVLVQHQSGVAAAVAVRGPSVAPAC